MGAVHFLELVLCLFFSNLVLSDAVCKSGQTGGILDPSYGYYKYCPRNIHVLCNAGSLSAIWKKPEDEWLVNYTIKIIDESNNHLLANKTLGKDRKSFIMSFTETQDTQNFRIILKSHFRQQTYLYISVTEEMCRYNKAMKEKKGPSYVEVKAGGQPIEGKPLNLICKVSGCSPKCRHFTWSKDNKTLSVTKKRLKFMTLSQNDTGLYSCIASNGISRKSSTIYHLEVKYDPRNVSIHGIEGTTFVLGEYINGYVWCTADCYPDCEFKIKKRNEIFHTRNSYWVGHVKSDLEGNYSCEASNEISTAESDPQYLRVFVKPASLEIAQSQSNVNNYDSITWTCSVETPCVPPCDYVWYDLQTNMNVTFSQQLQLSNVTRLDNGNTYRCRAFNDYGDVQKDKSLDVRYASVMIMGASSSFYQISKGDPLPELRCKASCNPSCGTAYLYKDNRTNYHTRLYARGATVSDAGTYDCRAEYPRFRPSQSIKSSMITITVQYNRVTMRPSGTFEIREGATADDIECSLSCSPDCRELELIKDGEHIQFEDMGKVFGRRVLNRNDRGIYKCIAITNTGQQIESDTLVVNIKYAPKMTFFSPLSLTVKENSTVNINFTVDSYPASYLRVYFKHLRLYSSLLSQPNVSYDVANASCVAAGTYEFEVWNIIGFERARVNLAVLCAPRIADERAKYIVKEKPLQSDVHISYKFSGHPAPNVTWEFQKMSSGIRGRLDNKTGVELGQNGTNISITLQGIKETDYGQYYTTLNNSEGNLQLIYELKPFGPPLSPTDVTVQCSIPGEARLTWRAQFQGGSPQTFKIYLRTNDTWEVFSENITDARDGQGMITKTVDELIPKVFHEFRIAAMNDDMIEVPGSNEANCTVAGYQSTQSYLSSFTSWTVGGAAGFLAVVILFATILTIVLVRKKRKMKATNEDGVRQNPMYETSTPASTTAGGGNVSSMASRPTHTTKQEKTVYAVAGQDNSHSAEGGVGNVYSVASHPALRDSDNVYSVAQTITKKQEGDKTRDSGNAYSQDRENEKQEQVYAEVKKEKKEKRTKSKKTDSGGPKPTPLPKTKSKSEKQSRTKNKDGLIYLDVEVTRTSSKDKANYIIGAENKTEYVYIDFTKHADPLPDTPPESSPEANEK